MAIDLKHFCDPYTLRNAPFLHDGYTWATDGRILVRADLATCPSTPPAEGKIPNNLQEIVGPAEKIEDWRLPPSIANCCEQCDGTGLIVCGLCAPCKGRGFLFVNEKLSECHECRGCGRELDGDDPDGTGDVCVGSCHTCDYKFGDKTLGTWYVNLIRALPNAMMGYVKTGSRHPVYFTFDGGIGCLIPLDRERKC